ncbi:MAG: hypothetical protein M1829_006484, partial [Trizodia sp. TS-e1964]
MSQLSVTYTLQKFLSDLSSIRNKTFTIDTIRLAFKKSGMWPINESTGIDTTLVTLPIQKTTNELCAANNKRRTRIEPLISSPSRPEFLSFSHGIAEVATTISLQAVKIGIYEQKLLDDLNASSDMSRRFTKQHTSGMTLEDGLELDREKIQKKDQENLRRQQKIQDNYLYSEHRKNHQL